MSDYLKRICLLFITAVVSLSLPSYARIFTVPGSAATIQGAISQCVNGDTVLVAPGNYRENISFRGKNITVASHYLTTGDPAIIQQTIIDGSMPTSADSGSVVRFVSRVDSTAQICGFTLINGIGTLVPNSFGGGGIYVTNASTPYIHHNIIRNNSAIIGAGIAVRNAAPTITHNAFVGNSAGDGGGLYLESSSAVVDHNVFYNNTAEFNGGALYIKNSFVWFTNNSVSHNTAPVCGGVHCNGGVWEMTNNNFYQNQLANFVGCGEPELGDISAAKNYNLDSADIYDNIAKNPLFVNPAAFDFHLACDSRLIDAGEELPAGYPQGGAREDVGMFEYTYRVGDLNGDNKINLADATALINVIFLGAPLGCPLYPGDCDCSRRINIIDIVALINYWSGFAETSCLFTSPQ